MECETNNLEKEKSQELNKKENKKSKRDSTEEMLSHALKVLKEPNPDELDIFGQYVATELRGIECEHIRRRLKREINLAIFRAQDDDERRQFLQSSPAMWSLATPSPTCFERPSSSSRYASTPPSQINALFCNEMQQPTLMPSFKHS